MVHTLELPDEDDGTGPASPAGPVPMAGVEGYAVAFARQVRTAPGLRPVYHAQYVAAAIVPGGRSTPPLAVVVLLDCPIRDLDPTGDHDLLRHLAAAISVDRDGR